MFRSAGKFQTLRAAQLQEYAHARSAIFIIIFSDGTQNPKKLRLFMDSGFFFSDDTTRWTLGVTIKMALRVRILLYLKNTSKLFYSQEC